MYEYDLTEIIKTANHYFDSNIEKTNFKGIDEDAFIEINKLAVYEDYVNNLLVRLNFALIAKEEEIEILTVDKIHEIEKWITENKYSFFMKTMQNFSLKRIHQFTIDRRVPYNLYNNFFLSILFGDFGNKGAQNIELFLKPLIENGLVIKTKDVFQKNIGVIRKMGTPAPTFTAVTYCLTDKAKNANYLFENSSRAARPTSKEVFIAMKFSNDLAEYEKHVKSALELIGLEGILIRDVEHNNEITQEILDKIENSKFVIADLTYQNNGVYFEAGYAKGIGKEVIFTINEEDRKNCHFDIRNTNTIG